MTIDLSGYKDWFLFFGGLLAYLTIDTISYYRRKRRLEKREKALEK